jgi:uncharacterized protein YbaR (Trm112 family)
MKPETLDLLACPACHASLTWSGKPSLPLETGSLYCAACAVEYPVEKGIPRFTDQVGHFLRLPEGRAFVMQVPGLLGVRLPDERAAAVTNWMIREFAGPSLPADFVPYSAAEARRHRESRPADIIGRRDEIYRTLLQQGLVIQ